MIKEFIETHDFSYLPIGPQADLIESLQVLNRTIPWQFKDDTYGSPNHPTIKFDVNKNFTWKYGTFKNAEIIKNFLEGTYKRKGFKWGSIQNIWVRPDRAKRSYTYLRFKNRIFDVDRALQQKRWSNAVWLEDGDEIQELFDTCTKEIVKIFDDYIKYIAMFNKDNVMEDGIDIIQTNFTHTQEDLMKAKSCKDNLLTEMWKFDDTKPKIILNYRNDNPSQAEITILHPFKDVMMNVFIVEDNVPVYRFPIGNVIGSYTITLESLMYSALNLTGGHRNTRPVTRYWFKPHVQGQKHPFINYHIYNGNSSTQRRAMQSTHPSDWTIEFSRSSNSCAGNMNIVEGSNKISIIKWVENVHTWISTFRLGITHPLNNIQQAYFSSPDNQDPNVKSDYLDRIGFNQANCYDRMFNYHTTATARNKLCNKICTNNIMENCNGYLGDLKHLEYEKVSLMFKEKEMYRREIHNGLPVNSLTLSEDTENDNYPMEFSNQIYHDTGSVEDDMLRWVSLNQNTQNR